MVIETQKRLWSGRLLVEDDLYRDLSKAEVSPKLVETSGALTGLNRQIQQRNNVSPPFIHRVKMKAIRQVKGRRAWDEKGRSGLVKDARALDNKWATSFLVDEIQGTLGNGSNDEVSGRIRGRP